MSKLTQYKIGRTVYVGITPTSQGIPRLQIKILAKVSTTNLRGKDGHKYNINTHLPHGYKFEGDHTDLEIQWMQRFVETLNEVAPGKYPELTFIPGYWKGFTIGTDPLEEEKKRIAAEEEAKRIAAKEETKDEEEIAKETDEETTAASKPNEEIAVLFLNGDELFQGSFKFSTDHLFPQDKRLEPIFDYDFIEVNQRDMDLIADLKKTQKLIANRLLAAA